MLRRSVDEIIDQAVKNNLSRIPTYLEEKRHKKYSYKKNLKSRRNKNEKCTSKI